MPESPPIHIRGLRKRFGRRDVLRGVDLRADFGTVTGLVGANGAGKSTTLRVLLGLVRADSGTATVMGHAYRGLPHPMCTVGAALEPGAFDPAVSGREHLRTLAALGGVPTARVEECIGQFRLDAYCTRPTGTWSTGMRRRLALASALLGDPAVLVLDEPTNGLDPDGIADLRDAVDAFAARGGCALVSSHVLHELEPVMTHAVVVRDGVTVAAGALADLRARTGAGDLAGVYARTAHDAASLPGEGDAA